MKDMTKEQLQEIAKRKQIKFTTKTTKAQLIVLLEGNKPKAVEGPRSSGEY